MLCCFCFCLIRHFNASLIVGARGEWRKKGAVQNRAQLEESAERVAEHLEEVIAVVVEALEVIAEAGIVLQQLP